MSKPPSRPWEALSLVDYPSIRNVQSIEIYNVNPGLCHPIENWVARMRRRIPRFELGSDGMERHFDNPLPRDDYTIKPEFVVRIMGDMISVTERGLVSILYPIGAAVEVVYVGEPSHRALAFDEDIYSWNWNNNVKPLVADSEFLTPQKEQDLLDLASRWIISRRLAWRVEDVHGALALDMLGKELRLLCEKSMERTLTLAEEDDPTDATPVDDEDEELYDEG